MRNVIELTINGEPRNLVGPMTVEQLVDTLGLAGKRIALERNGEIVPRSRYAVESVTQGDLLEIVVAVGGG